ncbi:predicted protein [Enterococcus faecalis T2]|uniref:DUF6906 domain-containing protein n=2 Tax=Enterococcus faecalis TaxID=1351 RepID=Q839M8_ENTFA|nr:hypothetical protein EF_0135 [Enterococcus faecalis V583]EET98137.1 predicted protein [Enterococcus faecalis T2]
MSSKRVGKVNKKMGVIGMKQEKRPVRKEKELLESRRLNPLNWLVERRLKSSIVFLHKGSGNLKEISNEGGVLKEECYQKN